MYILNLSDTLEDLTKKINDFLAPFTIRYFGRK